MPVYEEKLISPLAVRFTQEHIKTIFRDGHIVQDTAALIQARPTDAADYDLILSAPFPQIEIIRWGHSHSGGGEHWFTLDNRRLYCLQVAAAKHWPLRVAAKVEILYADPGAVRRKYDSTTFGASVTVSHSCKDAPLFRFDWHAEVQKIEVPSEKDVEADAWKAAADRVESDAWKNVAADDEKVTVDMLCDASEGNSALARFLEVECDSERKPSLAKGAERSSTPSTGTPSEEEDVYAECGFWRADQAGWSRTPRAPRGDGNGTWREERAALEAAQALEEQCPQAAQAWEEIRRQLRAPRWDGKLRVPNWNIRFGQTLGPIRKFLKARPDVCTVAEMEDGTFRVYKAENSEAEAAADEDYNAQATKALDEIKRQLRNYSFDGKLRIPNWQARYGQSLGSIRMFLESRPDVCTLQWLEDGSFRAWEAEETQAEENAEANQHWWSQSGWTAENVEALAAKAKKEIRAQLDPHGEACSVRINDWNGRYGDSLGAFKAFLRERSEEFTIVPGEGRLFSVALVTGRAGRKS